MTLRERVEEYARALDVEPEAVERELGEELHRAAVRAQVSSLPAADREALEATATPVEPGSFAALGPWLLADVLLERMRATAIPIGEASARMGLSDSALRRVLGATTGDGIELLGVKDARGSWRLFAFQFDGGGSPASAAGRRVQRELPGGMHPVAVQAWWDAPNAALYLDGRELAPRAWLELGLDPDRVVEAARHEDAA